MHSFAQLEAYVDLPELLNRVEGDRELLAELFRLSRDDLPENREALHEAIDGVDLGKVAIAAHKLKGMLANLSATRLASLAAQIERAARAGDNEMVKNKLPGFDAEIDGFAAALSAFWPEN